MPLYSTSGVRTGATRGYLTINPVS